MDNRSEGNLDALVGTFIAGYLGYTAGSRKFASWEPIIKNYNARISHLAYFKAIRPGAFLNDITNATIIYTEAILAYLFGLPDASIPTSLRCLEMGLVHKYTSVTGQPPSQRNGLYNLIEWAEQYLGNKKEIAHGFRLLRNLIHGQSVMSEQDALEALVHITYILNLLYPLSEYATLAYSCQSCGGRSEIDVPIQERYLGNIINTSCARCHRPTSILVI